METELFEAALASAASQLEKHAHNGRLGTAADRRASMSDCLSHALGIIELAALRKERAAMGDPRQRVNF